MAEPNVDPPPVARCPWCSAPLADAAAEKCPECGATITGGPEDQLPGVTTLDTEAILRARSATSRPRSRLLSFITGEVDEAPAGPASPESLAPPSDAVRREMLRMAIAAEVADLEAEVASLTAEARFEAGEPITAPAADAPDDADAATDAAAADAAEAEVEVELPPAGSVPPAAALPPDGNGDPAQGANPA